MNERTGFKGYVDVVVRDEFGNIKQEQHFPNTITNLFDEHIANLLSAGGESIISHMAIGSGTGQDASSTTLANLLDLIPLSGTTGSIVQLTGASDNDVQGVGYWAAGEGTGSVTEAGLFRYSGTDLGSMTSYTDSINVGKEASDTLAITWTITCGSS